MTVSPSPTKGKILIVDDLPENLNLLTAMLSHEGYEVRRAPNGPLALSSAPRFQPDLILLDIMMPGLDGFAVCEKLRTYDQTRKTPIIFLSALHETFDKVKAFQLGGTDYITKPFQVEEVLARVAHQLAIQDLKTQLEQQNQQLQREVVERKRAEEAAHRASQAKTDFLAKMGQGLRTPLNAILGHAQGMRARGDRPPEDWEALEIINRNGQHLQILLNGILDITKIEAGCVPVQCQDFELEDLLLGLQKRFQLQANTKGISLIVESDPTIPLTLHTDEIKLRQILANLLGNALKFTERGQICLQVARVNPAKAQIVIEPPGLVENVSTATEGPAQQVEKLRFEVVDTGLGIAPEAFDRLFEPFAQTSSGESLHQGSGLGLAISDQLVQLLGGKIEVESQVGVGSRFWFDLPIASTPSRLSNQPD